MSSAIAGAPSATSRPPYASSSDATAGPMRTPSASPVLVTALPATSSSGVRASAGSIEKVAGRFSTESRLSIIAAAKMMSGEASSTSTAALAATTVARTTCTPASTRLAGRRSATVAAIGAPTIGRSMRSVEIRPAAAIPPNPYAKTRRATT